MEYEASLLISLFFSRPSPTSAIYLFLYLLYNIKEENHLYRKAEGLFLIILSLCIWIVIEINKELSQMVANSNLS